MVVETEKDGLYVVCLHKDGAPSNFKKAILVAKTTAEANAKLSKAVPIPVG